MPLADYPDLGWLIRAVRVLPVVAAAALVGGIIGGFTIFAIDSALTWQPRPDLRADNQATAEQQQATKSVRIVGGAIPDPSAGTSAPPPAPQQRPASAQPAQMPAQLLTPKPLGAAQPLTQTKTQAQTPQSQPPAASAQQIPSQIPNTAATQQQSTRWPDALSRAHQGPGGAQQQTEAPQPNATLERSASRNSDADRKDAADERAGDDRAAAASYEDRTGASRRDRHGRRRAMMMSDMPRSGAADDTDMSSARGAKRLDARAYNRVYNSYGGAREDDPERAAASRSNGRRRFGSDERYYGRRGAIVREGPNQADQAPVSEATQPRGEPFWGGGFIRRDDRVRGSQDEGD
jgi:hypothetical protein